MKAAYFMKNGGPEVMQYGDFPDPVAAAGQVLVDVGDHMLGQPPLQVIAQELDELSASQHGVQASST